MAGGTKRLPRAVREQQMLDAAVECFAESGFHETSMDAVAARANISKPMLYLYYGSKEELFTACINREAARLLDAVSPAGAPTLRSRERVHTALVSFLRYVDENRASWRVVYRQAVGDQSFQGQIVAMRQRVIDIVARLLTAGSRNPDPELDFTLVATAIIGAGEAIADRISDGGISVDAAARMLEELLWSGLAGPQQVPALSRPTSL